MKVASKRKQQNKKNETLLWSTGKVKKKLVMQNWIILKYYDLKKTILLLKYFTSNIDTQHKEYKDNHYKIVFECQHEHVHCTHTHWEDLMKEFYFLNH